MKQKKKKEASFFSTSIFVRPFFSPTREGVKPAATEKSV